MTIDEAIKRYVDNAEYERTHGNLQGCLEFKQLAKWLKELQDISRGTCEGRIKKLEILKKQGCKVDEGEVEKW